MSRPCGWDDAMPLRAHPYPEDPVVVEVRRHLDADPSVTPEEISARTGLTVSTIRLAGTWITHLKTCEEP